MLNSACFADTEVDRVVALHDEYVDAVVANRLEKLRPLVSVYDLNEEVATELRAAFLSELSTSRGAGIRLKGETVKSVEIYSEGIRRLAFLRVEGRISHPIPPLERVQDYTVYAISMDGGETWGISTLSCFPTSQLPRLFPKYDGVPAIY